MNQKIVYFGITIFWALVDVSRTVLKMVKFLTIEFESTLLAKN
jgi:hypothetical protein